MGGRLRLAVLQRVITSYRLDLFRILGDRDGVDLHVFYGEDLPGTKVRSKPEIDGIEATRLKTRFLRLNGRIVPWHRGLLRSLEAWQPDVIISEGESHIQGYLAAAWYRRGHPSTRLVHWSLGGLPGVPSEPGSIRALAKRIGQSFADRYLVYSTFGRDALVAEGRESGRIVVAVNVSDTQRHLEAASQLNMTRAEARHSVGVEEMFTVLTIGALDPNKRLDLVLDAAAELRSEPVQFVILGSGGILPELTARAEREELTNVHFAGRVTTGIERYYRAGDALLLPGRGGMVISEAMAHGLPVIVHQADGTEYDLVEDRVTGRLLDQGTGSAMAAAIRELEADRDTCLSMGKEGQRRVRDRFTLDSLADQVLLAARGPTASELP